jgi:DNA (cytosine-5)-methyltransferase 1
LVVDLFAGGGGASTGIRAALGRSPDFAFNHDPVAIACHEANHPETRHFIEDVTRVRPAEVASGRPIWVLWLSPDCTHHSRAKGKKPRDSKRRALAEAAIEWAKLPKNIRPRIICLENVEEFLSWGPLDEEGFPIKERAGEDFRAWCAKLTDLGYRVEFTSLVAADYGTPTTRKRLFLIARCDGGPLSFPEPTHGPGRPNSWRPASEIIDWYIPCPSIFLTPEEGRTLGIRRPLAPATMRRIATGVRRFVLDTPEPFIVPLTHQGADRAYSLRDPLRTVTCANRGEFALVSPTLVQTGYGERDGQAPRALDLSKPLGTVVAGGAKHGLVAAFLSKFYGTSIGADVGHPLPTVTAGGCHLGAVHAFMVKYYGQGIGQPMTDPVHTIPTHDRFGLVMVRGEPYRIVDIGMRMLAPHELFRAQGFPEDYCISPLVNGEPITKSEQIRLCGNAVPPQPVEALVRQATGRYEGKAYQVRGRTETHSLFAGLL